MRETGSVKFWNEDKGFGFLVREGQPDVFVHKSTLKESGVESLAEGQAVTFEVVAGREGKPKAANLVIGLP